MIGSRQYIVADHLFMVKADETILACMTNYEPFRTDKADNTDALFSLTAIQGAPVSYIEEWRQDEGHNDFKCFHTNKKIGKGLLFSIMGWRRLLSREIK